MTKQNKEEKKQTKKTDEDNKALKLVNWISEKIIDGVPPLSSAQALATEYLIDKETYKSNEERVDALIKWESRKNFTSGFITGLGGFMTLPLAIPSAVAASWVVQGRMVAAIAHINGHDIKDEGVKTLILLSLVGNSAKDVLKSVGLKITDNLTVLTAMKLSGNILLNIQKGIGILLLRLVAQRGITHALKVIPFMGGIVTGGIDAYTCRKVGQIAKDMFSPQDAPKKAKTKPVKKTAKKAPAKKVAKKAAKKAASKTTKKVTKKIVKSKK